MGGYGRHPMTCTVDVKSTVSTVRVRITGTECMFFFFFFKDDDRMREEKRNVSSFKESNRVLMEDREVMLKDK